MTALAVFIDALRSGPRRFEVVRSDEVPEEPARLPLDDRAHVEGGRVGAAELELVLAISGG